MARRGWTPTHGSWAIAGTFVGTVVGAGFASGQETLRFFTAFGPAGLIGLALATLLFVGFGVRMLSLGEMFNVSSHGPLVHHAAGSRFGPMFDVLLTFFLLATAAAMASGASSTMSEQYGWPRWLGAAVMSGVSAGTVLAGIRGVVTAIAFVAPLLIGSVLSISAYSLVTGPGLRSALQWQGASMLAAVPFWWAAAALYVAYNMLLAVPVLAPLGANAAHRGAIRWGGLLGGLGLGFGAAAIHLAIAARMPGAAELDIPMLYTARTLPGWVPVAYSILLLAEVYTTAVAMLFGFASRLGREGGDVFRLAVVGGGIVAFIGGQFRFAEVVGTLYPVMGIAGLILLAGLLRRPRTR